MDTTKAAPYDTVYKFNFYYDNLKRNTRLEYISYQNTGAVDTSLNLLYSTVFYNANDTVPYKSINDNKYNGTLLRTTTFYTYNSAGSLLLKDSTFIQDIIPFSTDIQTDVTNYIYAGSNVQKIKKTFYSNSPNTSLDTFSYQITKQNGNIVTQQDNAFGTINNFSCLFDTKNAPMSKTVHSQSFYSLDINYETGDPTDYNQTNNIIEINNTSGTTNVHYKFFYIYNTLNYPREVSLQKIAGPSNSLNKVKYYYTN